jgi:hypothetical protein
MREIKHFQGVHLAKFFGENNSVWLSDEKKVREWQLYFSPTWIYKSRLVMHTLKQEGKRWNRVSFCYDTILRMGFVRVSNLLLTRYLLKDIFSEFYAGCLLFRSGGESYGDSSFWVWIRGIQFGDCFFVGLPIYSIKILYSC